VDVHWAGLGSVLLVGLIAGVGLVALFGFGVRLLAREPENGAATAARPVAIACFAVCAVTGAYGIYLLLQK
jgi:hypothetical protein